MIAVDSSSMIAYFHGSVDRDAQIVFEIIQNNSICLSPIVIAELVSYPFLEQDVLKNILILPILEIKNGYWERAGRNRSIILSKKLKARTLDSLIAQSCIDHDIPLITRDSDFRHFEKYCGLRLL